MGKKPTKKEIELAKKREEEAAAAAAKANGKKKAPPPKKKKKGCIARCCSCMVGLLLVFSILLGAAFMAGNYYLETNMDFSLFEVTSMVWDVFTADEKKIVTNSPRAQDEQNFYSKLSSSVYLKPGAINKQVLEDALETAFADSDAKTASYKANLADDSGGEGDNTDDEGGGLSDQIMYMLLSELFTRENFDTDRLMNFDYDDPSFSTAEYITDRELCAVINSMSKYILEKSIDDEKLLELASSIKISQIIMGNESISDENGKKVVTTLKITLEISSNKILNYVNKNFLNDAPSLQKGSFLRGLYDGVSGFVFNSMLPKKLFLSAKIGIGAEIPVDIEFNNFKKLSRAKEIAAKFGAGSFFDGFDKTINDAVTPILDGIKEYVDLETFENGKLQLDVFSTMLSLIDDGSGNALTSRDASLAMKALIASEFDTSKEAIENGTYNPADGYFYDPTDPTTLEYYPDPLDIPDGFVPFDWGKEFLNEIADKYAIDLSGADGIEGTDDDITFESLFNGAAGLDFVSLIDGKKLEQHAKEDDYEQLKVYIDDRSMAAILNEQIKNMMGTDGMFENADVKLLQVIITTGDVGGVTHSFMSFTISLDIRAMLGDDGFMSMLSGVLSERLYITMLIDITPLGELNGGERQDTLFNFNDLSYEDTDRLFDIISKLGIDFDKQELTTTVTDRLNEVLDSMASVSYIQNKVVMPSIFDYISEYVWNNEISGADIQSVLKEIYKGPEMNINENISDGIDQFFGDLQDNYYIKEEKLRDSQTGEYSIDAVMGSGGILTSFSTDIFNLTSKDGLFFDGRSASELDVVLPDSELGFILKDKMMSAYGSDPQYQDLFNIVELSIVHNGLGQFEIGLTIEIALDYLVGENNEYKSLFTVDCIYLRTTTTVGVDGGYYNPGATDSESAKWTGEGVPNDPIYVPYYKTVVTINEMNEATLATLNDMLVKIAGSGASALDFELRAMDIGRLFKEQLESLNDSVDGGIEFVDGGVKFPSFYKFMAKLLNVDNEIDEVTGDRPFGDNDDEFADNFKKVLQGLYSNVAADDLEQDEKTSGYNYDLEYFGLNDVLTNVDVNGELTDASSEVLFGGQAKTENFDFDIVVLPSPSAEITTSDRAFGGIIASALAGVGEIAQLNIVVESDTSDTAEDIREWAHDYYDISGGDYVLVTLEVDINQLGSGLGQASDLIPTNFYFTAIVGVNSTTYASLRINGLDSVCQNLMYAIMNIDPATIEDKMQIATDAVEKYDGTFEALEAADTQTRVLSSDGTTAANWSGIGKITFDSSKISI